MSVFMKPKPQKFSRLGAITKLASEGTVPRDALQQMNDEELSQQLTQAGIADKEPSSDAWKQMLAASGINPKLLEDESTVEQLKKIFRALAIADEQNPGQDQGKFIAEYFRAFKPSLERKGITPASLKGLAADAQLKGVSLKDCLPFAK